MIDRKTALYIVALTTFVTIGAIGGLLNIAWTYMQDTFSVELDALGILLFAATTGGLVAAFGSGSLIGRYQLGRVAVGGMILVIIGLLGYILSPSWVLLLLMAFVMAAGKSTLDAGMNNFVSANFDSTAMNWLHASWGLGLTIAPGIITFIIINLGLEWRAAYVVFLAIILVLTAVFVYTRPMWNINGKQDDDDTPEIKTPIMASLSQPMVRWSILLFFVYGGVEIGTGQLANTLLVDGRQFSQETSSLWISMYWGSFTIGRVLIGFMALRLSDSAILWGSMGLSTIGTALLTLSAFPTLSLIGLLLIGFGLAAIFPILIAQTPGRVGKHHAPNTIGFQVGFTVAGAAIIPGIASFLATYLGLETISHVIFLNALVMLLIYWLLIRREYSYHLKAV